MSIALRVTQLLTFALALAATACRAPGPPPLAWQDARATALAEWPVLDAAGVAAWARASGRPVVASLWARWCEPCLAEMPTLAALADATGAAWISIATDDPSDRPEQTLAALAGADRGARLLHARAPSGGPAPFFAAEGAEWSGMLPAHALFSAEGALVGVLEGALGLDAAADLSRRLGAAGAP